MSWEIVYLSNFSFFWFICLLEYHDMKHAKYHFEFRVNFLVPLVLFFLPPIYMFMNVEENKNLLVLLCSHCGGEWLIKSCSW